MLTLLQWIILYNQTVGGLLYLICINFDRQYINVKGGV
jgi:hypothetical protein